MKIHGSRWTIACATLAFMASQLAFAQQQNNQSQYEGVSHPPPNDTIVATEPMTPPPPPSAKYVAKPAASVPAQPTPPRARIQPARTAAPGPVIGPLKYANTDYGIVTIPVTPQQAAADQFPDSAPGSTAVLHTRPNYSGIVTTTPGSSYALPQGTEIRVRINNEMSTASTVVDTPFQGQIVDNVINNGSIVIPAGSQLKGFVSGVSQGHHLGTAATLRLDPQIIILPDGTAYHINAQVIDSDASGTRVGEEGGIKPSAHLLKKTAEYGVGAGTGAMVGAELAGPAGALTGGLIGAGLVTAHLFLQHPESATVPAGSQVVFSLTMPMYLTPTQN